MLVDAFGVVVAAVELLSEGALVHVGVAAVAREPWGTRADAGSNAGAARGAGWITDG